MPAAAIARRWARSWASGWATTSRPRLIPKNPAGTAAGQGPAGGATGASAGATGCGVAGACGATAAAAAPATALDGRVAATTFRGLTAFLRLRLCFDFALWWAFGFPPAPAAGTLTPPATRAQQSSTRTRRTAGGTLV